MPLANDAYSSSPVQVAAPSLVADIGGTNARFALCSNGALNEQSIKVLACNDYDNLNGAVQHYLNAMGTRVNSACMAFACPVSGEQVKMTNNHWSFNKDAMQKKLALSTFKVINDFTAQALALPALSDQTLIRVGEGESVNDAAKLIMGPGTGLGVAALKPVAGNWLPLPGEGGHAAFSAVSRLDQEILQVLQKTMAFISWESVLCGSGLERLYQAHATLKAEREGKGRPEALRDFQITEQAISGEPLARATLLHFCELLGRAASNAALTTGAQGGVYIAGGIIPRFPEFFASSAFRSAFETNDKMVNYLKAIPTCLVVSENPGLVGACEAITNPLVG